MKQLDAALKKKIHMYFMRTSVPRILADRKEAGSQKGGIISNRPKCDTNKRRNIK